ncbi:minor tail protein [Mycobacterium phage DuncansLeg]|nr:minor tail protein [Mycobacterium phage DuncansLeg]
MANTDWQSILAAADGDEWAAFSSLEDQAQTVRDQHAGIRRAKPLIRLWMNNPEGDAGLVYVGRVDYDDTINGSFPFKNNTPSQGILNLRDDHYLAVWLKKLPNDPALKKNVVITVDFYGGKKRWSGLLDHWKIVTKEHVKQLEVTFNDDLTFLQYLLCPPNPFLPIPVLQFPRIFGLAGPAKWTISVLILINLMRVQGNWWNLPDDPFDLESWDDAFDWSDWQCFVKANSFLLDDSSLWTFVSSRMNPIDSVIADSLDDAQLTITYRRILTDDGEVSDIPGVPNPKNGALVFEVVDNSNATALEGTFFEGTIVDGFARSVLVYGGGFVEDTLSTVGDDQTLQPDEYYQSGFLATMAKMPWLVVRDNEWTPIESSDLSWGPAKNVSVVVGGDNPAADAIAKLIITTTGNLLGYFLLGGFSSAGDIAADIIMPFIVGTIAAWLYWKNTGRATALGWVHYWELYQQGAESNSWSLAALAALRGGFLVGRAETVHTMALHDSWIIPGLHIDVGQRMGSTVNSKGVEQIIWVNQLEEMTAAWDHSGGGEMPLSWVLKAGKSDRAMSMGERMARLTKKMSEALNNVGVQLVAS